MNARVDALVLAGGRGARLGGVDKARLQRRGVTLIERTCTALHALGIARIWLSTAWPAHEFSAWPVTCIADRRAGRLGPLAGIEAGLLASDADRLLTWPVDAPNLPTDLLTRLCAAAGRDGAHACDADGAQPLCALYASRRVLTSLQAALDAGERAVHRWQADLDLGQAQWTLRFGNINTPADRQAWEEET